MGEVTLTCGQRVFGRLHMRQLRNKLFNVTDRLRSMTLLVNNIYPHTLTYSTNCMIHHVATHSVACKISTHHTTKSQFTLMHLPHDCLHRFGHQPDYRFSCFYCQFYPITFTDSRSLQTLNQLFLVNCLENVKRLTIKSYESLYKNCARSWQKALAVNKLLKCRHLNCVNDRLQHDS